jgi:hypothetical protein
MQTAVRNRSGWRQITASALKAPIDAPATTISIAGSRQSSRMAGTTSATMAASNWFWTRAAPAIELSSESQARPATLSTE